MKMLAVIAATAMLVACSPKSTEQATVTQDEASPTGLVTIESGEVSGVVEDGVLSYKGIPFARPPVGELRWRAPQPVVPWTGVLDASEYAHDCMQEPFPSDAAPLGTEPAEDCLYVNVWRPDDIGKEKLPVLVWIYGGGFVNGGSSPAVYSGHKFAKQGLIFVSFNYRVGRFGFFAHPALTAENPDGPLGNYGYMDQIAALKWVQKNIGSFGGDKDNVTVFGESAGGGSVLMLMVAEPAHGLFQKAIVESGGGRGFLLPPRLISKTNSAGIPSAESVGIAFAKSAGIEGTGPEALAALRSLPAETVTGGLNLAAMNSPTYVGGPLLDGVIVKESPSKALASGKYPHIPLIIGANNVDIGFSFAKTMDEVFASFGANKDKARSIYDPENSGDIRTVGYKVAMDKMMIEPARHAATTLHDLGIASYEYRFSYVAESLRGQWPGAFHATEIPYVFNTVAAKYGADLTDSDQKIAATANTYWANFAKSGNPNGDGLTEWPIYDPDKDVLLEFTNDGAVAVADPWKSRLDLTAATYSD